MQPGSDGKSAAPLVGIGMPVFNSTRHLEEAVRSLLDQTEQRFVILISDDCSTDETPSICERLSQEDSRVRYVKQESHLGSARNFEYVLRNLDYPFFMWAAHDDVREPEFIEAALQLLEADPDAVGCASSFSIIDKNGDILEHVAPPMGLQSESVVTREQAVFFRGWTALYSVYRRSRMGRDLRYPDTYGGDAAFVFRMALRGRFLVSARELLTYRSIDLDAKLGGTDGYEGHLYNLDATGMYRVMMADVTKSRLPWRTKADLYKNIAGRWLAHARR